MTKLKMQVVIAASRTYGRTDGRTLAPALGSTCARKLSQGEFREGEERGSGEGREESRTNSRTRETLAARVVHEKYVVDEERYERRSLT